MSLNIPPRKGLIQCEMNIDPGQIIKIETSKVGVGVSTRHDGTNAPTVFIWPLVGSPIAIPIDKTMALNLAAGLNATVLKMNEMEAREDKAG